MNHKKIKELDRLGDPYKGLAFLVHKAKKPVKHEDIDKIVRKTLFKRTYPIDESHFEKLEEYGFLERTEDGYVTSDLFKEWVKENTKTRKAKTIEKIVNPLGLKYFHDQKYSLENLSAISDKQEEMMDEYEQIAKKDIKEYMLKFWLPALTVMAAGLFADPFGYGKPMTLGGMAWLLFGHNYIECKSGEKITDLVEKYREELL